MFFYIDYNFDFTFNRCAYIKLAYLRDKSAKLFMEENSILFTSESYSLIIIY